MTVREMTEPLVHPRFNLPCACFPDIEEILRDASAHDWLRFALAWALTLESMDVAKDAEVLAGILDRWADHEISDHSPSA